MLGIGLCLAFLSRKINKLLLKLAHLVDVIISQFCLLSPYLEAGYKSKARLQSIVPGRFVMRVRLSK